LKSVLKNGNKHLEIGNISWTFTASKLNLKFDNLFNGDKALGNLFAALTIVIRFYKVRLSEFISDFL